MKIISSYIFKTVSFGLLVAVLLLLAVDVLFSLIKELNDINSSYSLGDVFFFVMLTIPSKLYELFPVSVVVAVVVSLGALASGSELVVMLSAGMSKLRIAMLTLVSVGFWLVLVVMLGEYVGPAGDQMAQQFRNEQISQGKATLSANAIWLRDGDVIFRTKQMRKIEPVGSYELTDVTVFELQDKRLAKVSDAKRAVYANQQWTLSDLKVSVFGAAGVSTVTIDEQQWLSRIQPDILNISTTRPKYLSLRDIKKFQRFSASTGSMQSSYQIAWWSKLAFPLLVLTTAMCGIVVLFGQIRTGGFAQRLVVGIVIGIVVYLVNKTLLNFGEVYHINPVVVTVLPALTLFILLTLRLTGRLPGSR